MSQPPQYFTTVPEAAPFRAGAEAFSPPWLRGYVGARYMFAQSIQWDTLAEYTRLGVIQRFPTKAEPNALGELGRDRKILRGLAETDAHYAERLRKFKTTWKLAGNAPTLLRQLWEYMAPNATKIRYVANGYDDPVASSGSQFTDWWTIDDSGLTFERASPSNWDWDGAFTKNVRFWLIVYRTDLTPAAWGVPPYAWGAPGLFWGGAPGSDRSWVIDVFNMVANFKAAGSHMGPWPSYDGGLIVADPSFVTAPWGASGPFPPDGAPGYPMPDGNFNEQDSRPPGAVYITGL